MMHRIHSTWMVRKLILAVDKIQSETINNLPQIILCQPHEFWLQNYAHNIILFYSKKMNINEIHQTIEPPKIQWIERESAAEQPQKRGQYLYIRKAKFKLICDANRQRSPIVFFLCILAMKYKRQCEFLAANGVVDHPKFYAEIKWASTNM